MSSAAHVSVDLPVPPEQAAQAVNTVIEQQRHTLLAHEGNAISFTTKKTMLTWELQAQALITGTPTGSQVELTLDTHPDRPSAMLDGKKNEKAAQKLADQIRAAV